MIMDSIAPTDFSKLLDAQESDQPRYAQDKRLYKQFYLRPILLTAASEEAQRPIYRDVEHIRILIPGDKLSIVDRIASPDDKMRFPEEYAKFKAGEGQEVVGTRLEAVPWMSRSKVEEYKFFNILTVEQLADASDEVGQKFPGFQSDKAKSKAFLEASSGTNARVSELEKQLQVLQAQLALALKPRTEDVPKPRTEDVPKPELQLPPKRVKEE